MNRATVGITPQAFWDAYREAFRTECNWTRFQDKKLRTKSAKSSAKTVIEMTFGFNATKEWFRIDYIGDIRADDADPKHNWFLRIAFDHENCTNWRYEFGSHVHIA